MALEFVQEPINSAQEVPVITNWNPVIGYMLKRNSSIASLFYYKLVFEVYVGTGVVASRLVAKLKQRRNGYTYDVTNNLARAYFDMRDIVNSQLVDTIYDQNSTLNKMKTIHKLGENNDAKIFSLNGDMMQTYGDGTSEKAQLLNITVRGYENYSDAANTSPTDDTSDAVTDQLYWMAGSLPLFQARDTDTDYLQGTPMRLYQMNDSAAYFLSDVQQSAGPIKSGTQYRNYVQDTDYHTIGFLNGEDDFDSLPKYFAVQYYDSDNALIDNSSDGSEINYFENTEAKGGAKPETGAGGQVDADRKRLLYLGCGPANLQEQNANYLIRPSYYPNWAYYKVYATSTNPTDPETVVKKSASYYFFKQDGSCKGFKVRRLAWRNSLGCWDYFNFKMKSEQTINVERNNYSTLIGEFNQSRFSYSNSSRGENTRQTSATLEETLNTDWITEQDAELLEKLIVSTNVEIVENSDTEFTQGVMVADSSFVRKTIANDKMIRYTIKIKYANPLNTNS